MYFRIVQSDVIVLKSRANKQIAEHASVPGIIWFATETHSLHIIHVFFELIRYVHAELVQADARLPIHD